MIDKNVAQLLGTLRERQTLEYNGVPHTLWSVRLREDGPPLAELWTLPDASAANNSEAMERWEPTMKMVALADLIPALS